MDWRAGLQHATAGYTPSCGASAWPATTTKCSTPQHTKSYQKRRAARWQTHWSKRCSKRRSLMFPTDQDATEVPQVHPYLWWSNPTEARKILPVNIHPAWVSASTYQGERDSPTNMIRGFIPMEMNGKVHKRVHLRMSTIYIKNAWTRSREGNSAIV